MTPSGTHVSKQQTGSMDLQATSSRSTIYTSFGAGRDRDVPSTPTPVKVKDYASPSFSPAHLETAFSLDDLLKSYGALSITSNSSAGPTTATTIVPAISGGLFVDIDFPSATPPNTHSRPQASSLHPKQKELGILTPPTSDDGATLDSTEAGKRGSGKEGEVKGEQVHPVARLGMIGLSSRIPDLVGGSTDSAGPPAIKDTDQTSDPSLLLDFSHVYRYLADVRATCLATADQRAESVRGRLDSWEEDLTPAEQEDPDDPLPVEFRELGAPARTAYYANSPFLRATRDTSVRRPRGQVLPSALDMDVTPLKTLLPIEAYYTPNKSRIMTSIERLAKTLPSVFPNDAEHLARYAEDPELALGDRQGAVEWVDGIGKMIRDDTRPNTVGYTGGVGSDKKGGVHLFLDHSNIFLSYLATLAEKKVDGIPSHARKTLSIPILTMLMARGRPIKAGRMHLVGSYPMMQDLDPAVKLGWRCTVMKRVPVDAETELAQMEAKAKRYGKGGAATSESDVGATTDTDVFSRKFKEPAVQVRKNREQGVDEMLQLKLLQTVIKNSHGVHHQGTIVLATGDGHGGQYNLDGFVGCVRDALRHGWAVELWAWNSGLSRAWEREKLNKEGNFVLWNLDHWLGDLVELK